MNTCHLGRFSFKLPKQLALSTQEQTIYGVDVSSKNKGTVSTVQYWQSNLHKIKALGATNLSETDDILPDSPAVFYQPNSLSEDIINLVAQIESNGSILTAILQGNKNKKDEIVTTVRTVLKAYKHGDSSGFHVGSGVLTSAPDINEYATATYINEVNDIELEIDIEMAGYILEEDPLLDINEDIIALKEEGVDVDIIQKEPYDLGLLKGTKSILALSTKGEETLLNYMWFSAGETANPLKPEVLIKATMPKKGNAFFEEQWNNILDSLHFRES